MSDETIEVDEDQALTMVDEALVAGNIANTNGLLVILAKLVAKGVFDGLPAESGPIFIVVFSGLVVWLRITITPHDVLNHRQVRVAASHRSRSAAT